MGMVRAIDHVSDPPPSLQKTAEHPTEKPGAPQKNCKVEGRSRTMVLIEGVRGRRREAALSEVAMTTAMTTTSQTTGRGIRIATLSDGGGWDDKRSEDWKRKLKTTVGMKEE